ncbi:pilus assembly protein TadG-related protein [Kamptonema cortianum]|nr:pilus assembly protein TadG-related protein [Geitlerinema splendidum]MDK3161246.1 pilus assembly protein TadG-related protein [Kamptonema cortianum]
MANKFFLFKILQKNAIISNIGGENMFSQLRKEKKMRSFFGGEKGAVAILFALALIPILGFLGLTIDIGQIYQLHAIVSGAVDSAALAGARAGGSNSNMTQHAIAVFNANIPTNKSWTVTAPTVSISSDSKTITVSATITSPTTFMTLLPKFHLCSCYIPSTSFNTRR